MHIFPRESISFKIVCPFIAQSVSWSVGCTMGRMTMKLTPWVTHLLAPHCSRRSRAPLRLFVHSLTRSFRSSWERSFCLSIERIDFIQIQPTVDPRLTGRLVFFPPPSPCSSSCWSIHPKRDELMDERMDKETSEEIKDESQNSFSWLKCC